MRCSLKLKPGSFYFLRNGDIVEVFAIDLPTDRPVLAVLYMTNGWQAIRYTPDGRVLDASHCVLDVGVLPSGELHEIDRQTLQELRTSGRIPKRQNRRRSVGVQRVQRAVNGRGPANSSKNS